MYLLLLVTALLGNTLILGEQALWSDALPWVSTVVFLDYDLDGDLDLFLGSEEVNQSQFLENTGDFTFLDATEGIGLDLSSGILWAIPVDWDQDGASDLALVETYDDRTLKVYKNQGGTFTPYLALPLPAPPTGSPLLYDYDQDGTPDLFLPCKTGLFLLTHLGTPDLHWTPLLKDIRPQELLIFDAGRDDTLDLLIRTPTEWLLWKDFEREGPVTQVAPSTSMLFPLSITPDSQTDYLSLDATGNLSLVSIHTSPQWIGTLSPSGNTILKLSPLYMQQGAVVALALTSSGTLSEVKLSDFTWTSQPLLQNIQDFKVVSLAKDPPLQILVLRSDSVFLYPLRVPSLLRFGPADSVNERLCLLSQFRVYIGPWTAYYRPVFSTQSIFYTWWASLVPDSIVAYWGTGSKVTSSVSTLVDSVFPIPLAPTEEYSSPSEPILNLLEIYPNPATQYAQIRYVIPEASLVELTLNTLTGQQLRVLERAVKAPGTYTLTLDLQDLPPGHYLVNLRLNGETHQNKLIVLR